ncbi:MAG: hypothetical protein M1837_002038 [Sclerophora amabilis]|nr:MAG: hypothetical protein M1837_002038 [Sclerophora amabilis]
MTLPPTPSSEVHIEAIETPILFLKNPSNPIDPYETYFRDPALQVDRTGSKEERDEEDAGQRGIGEEKKQRSLRFSPEFLPVQEFRFHAENLERVRSLILEGSLRGPPDSTSSTAPEPAPSDIDNNLRSSPRYGGLIFTSPRAVSAFISILPVDSTDGSNEAPPPPSAPLLPPTFPIYTVGPATASLLSSNPAIAPSSIHGEHTGNGGALAELIIDHYGQLRDGASTTPQGNERAPPLLFLAGEQRRDILPRTLQSAHFAVDELVVYEAVMREGFRETLTARLDGLRDVVITNTEKNIEEEMGDDVWVVIFSPSGCKELLQYLDLVPLSALDTTEGGKTQHTSQGSSVQKRRRRGVKVATIGPTTRDYLSSNFGIMPDVCASRPSPEGVASGIRDFLAARDAPNGAE